MSIQNGSPRSNGKLQVGNGYTLEFDQLARLLSTACHDQRYKIPQSDLASSVGVADRKIENLGSLANALSLVSKGSYKPTPLGRLVQARDSFFDDLGTLWFLHYAISSEPRHIIWNRAVNEFIPRQSRFTREQLRASFDDLRTWYSEYSLKAHVLKEINTFLDAYTQQAFSRLGFLRLENGGLADGWYAPGYRQPLPPLVLAASMARFRDTHRPGATAIPVSELCCAADSPGVVYQLPEERLRSLLEQLIGQRGFSLESRADLDQVRLEVDLTDVVWMRRYYDSR